MNKQRGFTLIELLVVIAIIALLMAILIPALHRVKKYANGVVCRSNPRQWGFCFSMYAGDNNGDLPEIFGGVGGPYGQWAIALNPYYGDQKRIWCCPTAEKPLNNLCLRTQIFREIGHREPKKVEIEEI